MTIKTHTILGEFLVDIQNKTNNELANIELDEGTGGWYIRFDDTRSGLYMIVSTPYGWDGQLAYNPLTFKRDLARISHYSSTPNPQYSIQDVSIHVPLDID
jgi:hypothetical protein